MKPPATSPSARTSNPRPVEIECSTGTNAPSTHASWKYASYRGTERHGARTRHEHRQPCGNEIDDGRDEEDPARAGEPQDADGDEARGRPADDTGERQTRVRPDEIRPLRHDGRNERRLRHLEPLRQDEHPERFGIEKEALQVPGEED